MNRIVYLSLVMALLVFPSTVSPQGSNRYGDTTLREGANVRVRFPDNLDSDRNRNGDRFEAVLDQDLASNGSVVARAGSVVYFRLVDVQARRPFGDPSKVSLTLTGIQVGSSVVPIETNTVTVGTAPNRNQKLDFRLERSAVFNAREGQYGITRRGESGRRIEDIAHELNTRAQHLSEMTRGHREETRGRRRDGTSDLSSAVDRFAEGTRTFTEGRNFETGASRRAARSLVSQAEEISRLMARGDAAVHYRDDWRLVEDQVGQLSDTFGLRYTPTRELPRGDNRGRGRERGYERGEADHGTFRWRGRVDGSDYIELRRDQVTVRHAQSQPITEATYNVTSPLPRQPVTVQLNKLQGRGKVVLTQQPSSANNYTAIVYIEDNDGGNDFYEFELSW